jgi:hypothetical protein
MNAERVFHAPAFSATALLMCTGGLGIPWGGTFVVLKKTYTLPGHFIRE